MLNKAGEILDEDEFVYDRIRAAINVNKNNCQHMNEYMTRGQILEDYIVSKN